MINLGMNKDSGLEIIELDGTYIALSGWNGESYTDCFEVDENGTAKEEKETFTLRPIAKWQAGKMDISSIEENTEEWEEATQIVDYIRGL